MSQVTEIFYDFLSKNFTFASLLIRNAGVVKLVDTLDLGSSAARHGGSSPSTRTENAPPESGAFNFNIF